MARNASFITRLSSPRRTTARLGSFLARRFHPNGPLWRHCFVSRALPTHGHDNAPGGHFPLKKSALGSTQSNCQPTGMRPSRWAAFLLHRRKWPDGMQPAGGGLDPRRLELGPRKPRAGVLAASAPPIAPKPRRPPGGVTRNYSRHQRHNHPETRDVVVSGR